MDWGSWLAVSLASLQQDGMSYTTTFLQNGGKTKKKYKNKLKGCQKDTERHSQITQKLTEVSGRYYSKVLEKISRYFTAGVEKSLFFLWQAMKQLWLSQILELGMT